MPWKSKKVQTQSLVALQKAHEARELGQGWYWKDASDGEMRVPCCALGHIDRVFSSKITADDIDKRVGENTGLTEEEIREVVRLNDSNLFGNWKDAGNWEAVDAYLRELPVSSEA